jgi:hypothetical protein
MNCLVCSCHVATSWYYRSAYSQVHRHSLSYKKSVRMLPTFQARCLAPVSSWTLQLKILIETGRRCDVVIVGHPCSNCQQDQSTCVLHVSARGKHKRRRKDNDDSTKDAEDSAAAIATTVDSGGPAAVAQVLFALSTGGLPVENASLDPAPLSRRSTTNFGDADRSPHVQEDDYEPKLPMYVGM